MIGLALAIPLALLAVREDRLRSRVLVSLAGALAALAVATPWALFLSALPSDSWPRALLDFTAYRETPEIPPFELSVATDGPIELLRDRAAGLAVAFSPSHPLSYARSFGMSVYLVPLAAIALLWTRASTGRWAADADAGPARWSAPATATLLAAAGCLAPVHLHHATYIWEWWFHWRHGLPMIFAIVVALAWLNARAPRWGRAFALLLVGGALATAPLALAGVAQEFRVRARGPAPDEQALLAWVAAQPEAPLLVATRPQVLAAFARGGRYHWIDCRDDAAQLEAMLRHLRVDGVVVYPGEERCRWAPALPARGATPRRFGGITLWSVSPGSATPPASSAPSSSPEIAPAAP
jgi:hypothetical protein